VIAHELVGVTPLDPITTGICAVVMLVAGLSASYFPVRRAANVEPIAAIRCE
jgi:ABC-type lipoprotein release transport system permease subunit